MARILVIEDDPVNAELFELVLSRMARHTVTVTEDGDFALAQYNSGVVDGVIMDVSLSNTFLQGTAVDGLRLSKAMKSGSNGQFVPILLATAHAMRDDMENFLIASAADDYISKPIVDFGKLVDAVDRLLEKARQHRTIVSSL
ncbi:MAG TPA: response regulator [Bacteroidota bacterium]|nr:response regulator [Bacteroidota bacterium]